MAGQQERIPELRLGGSRKGKEVTKRDSNRSDPLECTGCQP
jgi:hypothetical protein